MIEPYELKNGKEKWKVNEYLGTDHRTGKEIKAVKQGFNSRREAKNFVAREKVKFEQGQIKQKQQRKYFEDVYDLWFLQYKNTVKPVTHYKLKAKMDKHLLPVLGGAFIDAITLEEIQKLMNKLFKQFKNANEFYNTLDRIYKFAISMRFCDYNPVQDIIKPKAKRDSKKRETSFYTKEQVLSFFENINGESDQIKTAYHLFFFTGVRNAEIIGLRWADIDFSKGTLYIQRAISKVEGGNVIGSTKNTSSERTISLDQTTIFKLRKWKLEQTKILFKFGMKPKADDQQYILINFETNDHLESTYFGSLTRKLIKRYNLPRISPHGFRHTHCSLLFEAGVSIKDVQDRLGHRSYQTTMNIYTHVTNKRRDETADTFAEFMLKN